MHLTESLDRQIKISHNHKSYPVRKHESKHVIIMELFLAYPLYSAAAATATAVGAYYYASSPAPVPEVQPCARWGSPQDKVDIRIQVFTNENPARFPRKGGMKRSSSHSSALCDTGSEKVFGSDLMTELKSIVLPIKARIDTGDESRVVKEEKKTEEAEEEMEGEWQKKGSGVMRVFPVADAAATVDAKKKED